MSKDAPEAGRVVEWRGPAPFYFLCMEAGEIAAMRTATTRASYGWGCLPVVASTDQTTFRTSLFPRNGGPLLPLKLEVRHALKIAPGDRVKAIVRIGPARPTGQIG